VFRWLYRVLFARRACWRLEKWTNGEVSRIRITLYDPEPEDYDFQAEWVRGLVEDGWTVIVAPRRTREDPDA
jgi:hypothetical protein